MHTTSTRDQKYPVSTIFAWMSALGALGTLLCFGAFAIMGSTVDAQGLLHEPFFLVPAGYVFLAVFLASTAGWIISRLRHSR